MINAACSEKGLLDLYRVELTQQPQKTSDLQNSAIDGTAQKLLEVYHPVMLEQYAPLSVLGDGNCLYRAISRSLCGNENLHMLIRLKTAIEIIINRKYYDTGRRSYVDLINDNRIIVTDYKKLVEDTLKLGSYSEMIHIYAISAVLNVPLRSYYPPQLQPELASDAYTKKVVGRGVKSACSSDIIIMWSQMCFPRNIERFTPNHFVTLRDIGSEPVETVIVSDDELHACSKPKKKDKLLKLNKKTENVSSNGSAHSEYVHVQTSGQTDTVFNDNCGSLSSSKEIGCSVEDSMSDQSVSFADNFVDASYVTLHTTNQTTETTKQTANPINATDIKIENNQPTNQAKQKNDTECERNKTTDQTKQTAKTKPVNDKERDGNVTTGQTKQTTKTNPTNDNNCDTDLTDFTVLSDVSDLDWTNDWREPNSREISDLDRTRQTDDNLKEGNDSSNESFDHKNLDESLAFDDHTDSDTTYNSISSDLNNDCEQSGALTGTFMEVNALVTLLQKSESCPPRFERKCILCCKK